MALSININVPSLNAQRQLGKTSNSLNTTLERLSSGLRINRASDDAAGLAISNGLTAQTRGLNQAVRNAGDGLSLLGTAESAIGEQTTIVQRLRELAVQASSDTNSAANRTSLNDEASALTAEFERIARTSDFNGVKLLDGSFTGKDLQVGAFATANDRLTVNFGSTLAASIGSAYSTTSVGRVAGTMAAGDVKISVGGVQTSVGAAVDDGVSDATPAGSALAYATAINAVSADTGVTATASTTITGVAAQTAGSFAAGDVTINGVDLGAVTLGAAGDSDVVDAINSVSGETGVTAELDSSNQVVLTAADGRNIHVEATAGANAVAHFAAVGAVDATTRGTITLSSAEAFTLTDTDSDLNLTGGASVASVKDTSKNVGSISLKTKADALEAIGIMDTALSELNKARSGIGAQTNRLNTVISNLTAAAENASSANSRVLDADFASETANMTRTQILQQAGVAVLSQANQNPQLALSLLG